MCLRPGRSINITLPLIHVLFIKAAFSSSYEPLFFLLDYDLSQSLFRRHEQLEAPVELPPSRPRSTSFRRTFALSLWSLAVAAVSGQLGDSRFC
jgi:hypothetical protein